MLNQTVELGVTGLARSGKTIFIAALIHNLLRANAGARPAPLAGWEVIDQGRFVAAGIRHQASPLVPQFPQTQVVDSLVGESPVWPVPTEGIARIRVELRYRAAVRWRRLARTLTGSADARLLLEIVDYPGEWLADLPLLEQSFESWSAEMLRLAEAPPRAEHAREWRDFVRGRAPGDPHDEEFAERASTLHTRYLERIAAPDVGLRFVQPGRALRPAHLRGSPVLRFCPLPGLDGAGKPRAGSLHAEFRRRFERYKSQVVRRFFREHFARLRRQVVLIDALSAIDQGPAVFDDTSRALAAILPCFRHGRHRALAFLGGRRIDRVLFAATKADHVVRGDRARLAGLTGQMLGDIDGANAVRMAADWTPLALASIRATGDAELDDGGEILIGRRPGEREPRPISPGRLPERLPPVQARPGFRFWEFEPPLGPDHRYVGFPNIGLGAALDYLIGDLTR